MKSRLRFLLISMSAGLILGGGTFLAAAARRADPQPDSLYKYLSVFTEVLGLVRQAYVEEVDVERLLAGAYEGTADALDPFSVFVPESEAARFLALRAQPRPDLGLFLIRERGWVYAAGVLRGGAADAAGMRRGDLLSRIEGELTRDLEVWQIEERLVAASGQRLTLEVLRRGEPREVSLEVVAKAAPSVKLEEVRGVPVVRLGRFAPETAQAVEESLAELAPTQPPRLVFDVRGVGGLDAVSALSVADLLVDGDGPLGSLERWGADRRQFDSAREAIWSGEVVVLVDRGTLGAAELFARILQVRAGARLVGESTYGYAGHQDLIELSSGALLEITDGFYAGPDGEPLKASLEPDVLVDERSRRLDETDTPFDEIILQRGLDVLLDELEVEKAAA